MTDSYKTLCLALIKSDLGTFLETAIRTEIDVWDFDDDFSPFTEIEYRSNDFSDIQIRVCKDRRFLTFKNTVSAVVDGKLKSITTDCIFPGAIVNSGNYEQYMDDDQNLCLAENTDELLWQIACCCPDYYYPVIANDPLNPPLHHSVFQKFLEAKHLNGKIIKNELLK